MKAFLIAMMCIILVICIAGGVFLWIHFNKEVEIVEEEVVEEVVEKGYYTCPSCGGKGKIPTKGSKYKNRSTPCLQPERIGGGYIYGKVGPKINSKVQRKTSTSLNSKMCYKCKGTGKIKNRKVNKTINIYQLTK